MRSTGRFHVAQVGLPVLAAVALLAVAQVDCSHNPAPPPSGPGGSGGSTLVDAAPAPVPEPGPVPPGDPGDCSDACQNARKVCPSVGPAPGCEDHCRKIGGANPVIVRCWKAAKVPAGAKDACAVLTACGAPSSGSGGGKPIPHGR